MEQMITGTGNCWAVELSYDTLLDAPKKHSLRKHGTEAVRIGVLNTNPSSKRTKLEGRKEVPVISFIDQRSHY